MSDITANIRLIIMGKDENVMRVDLRVPLGIYEKIELLSEKTNQPFTPKTKNSDNPKRIVTPIVLKLIELGLGVIDEDSSQLSEDLVSISFDNSETIENRLFERLEKRLTVRLDELIESRLELFEARITADTSPPEIDFFPNEIKSIEDSSIEPNEPKEDITPEIDEDVSALETIEGINEVNSETANETIEVKPFEEAILEIQKLKEQGLGNTAIAKELTGKYFTTQGKTNWSDTQVKRVLNKLKNLLTFT